MGLIQDLSINITLSYRIYNLVIALTSPLSEQRLPYLTPEKGTLLGWEVRDQVLDQPLACFCINPCLLPWPSIQTKPFNSFKKYLHPNSPFLTQLAVNIARLF